MARATMVMGRVVIIDTLPGHRPGHRPGPPERGQSGMSIDGSGRPGYAAPGTCTGTT